ncbi:MAG: AI-2E family transporter [Mariprofundales bacterium]|nr:AI-2E family transporter [Mariprofundales bacterium]
MKIERRLGIERRSAMYRHPVIRASIILLLGLCVTTLFLIVIHPVLFSLAISLALFAMLTPSLNLLLQSGWSTTKGVSTIMAMTTIFIIAIGAILYPIITDQVQQISQQANQLDQRLIAVFTDINKWLTDSGLGHFNPQKLASTILTTVSSNMDHIHREMSAFFADIATSLLLIPLITFFLLCDFKTLRNQTMQLLPNRYFELGWIIYTRAASQLMNYVGGLSTQAVIMAAICTLGFWIVGVDYAPLLGITIGLLNTIPFFGIALAKIPPVVVVLISDEPSGVGILLALAVVFAAQAFDNSYVIPKIVAKSANLHPLTVMLGVMLGGYYCGFFGLILSVPTIFSLKVVHRELINGLRRQSAHKID